MPAFDYRAPAISSARELTFWSRFNRAVALVLAFMSITMLVTTVTELNESPPDSTFLLGGIMGGAGFGIFAVAMWRLGTRRDVEVRQPGERAGLRELGPLPPAEGPVHVCLAESADGAIVLTGDGLHLPAGILTLGPVTRLIDRWEYRALGTPIEVPCFVPWSQVVWWSYSTPVGSGSGVHTVELTDRRYLRFTDAVIDNRATILLDAVRSLGAQHIDVQCSVNGLDSSTAATTT